MGQSHAFDKGTLTLQGKPSDKSVLIARADRSPDKGEGNSDIILVTFGSMERSRSDKKRRSRHGNPRLPSLSQFADVVTLSLKKRSKSGTDSQGDTARPLSPHTLRPAERMQLWSPRLSAGSRLPLQKIHALLG